MIAGRKPKPTNLKKLQGNPGGRPLGNEPAPDVCIPSPPEHLNPDAIIEWNRITPLLETMGLITLSDMAAIAAYCQNYGRWVEAEKLVASDGMIVYSDSGYPSHHPSVSIANNAMDKMYKFLIEFGLTPSSRARLGSNTAKKKDKMDEYLSKPKNSPIPENIQKFAKKAQNK